MNSFFERSAASAIFIFFSSVHSLQAEASRTISIPPLKMVSSHGGVMGSVTCNGMGMVSASSYGGGSGVRIASHNYTLSFSNASSIAQTITITVLPGTEVNGLNSNGASAGINLATSFPTPRTITSPQTLMLGLPPNGNTSQDINLQTTFSGSAIMPFDAGLNCDTAPEQVCMFNVSTLILTVTVAEDRGAVLGFITSSPSRCYGLLDLPNTPPYSLPMNGGRPF